jgi:hypothetical protein
MSSSLRHSEDTLTPARRLAYRVREVYNPHRYGWGSYLVYTFNNAEWGITHRNSIIYQEEPGYWSTYHLDVPYHRTRLRFLIAAYPFADHSRKGA